MDKEVRVNLCDRCARNVRRGDYGARLRDLLHEEEHPSEIIYPKSNPEARFHLVFRDHSEVIEDTKNKLNIFSVFPSGMGSSASSIRLAKSVVDFLNAHPQE